MTQEAKPLEDYPPILTFAHLREILGVSRPTLYKMIARHQLIVRHLGPRRVGFSKAEVKAQFGL